MVNVYTASAETVNCRCNSHSMQAKK